MKRILSLLVSIVFLLNTTLAHTVTVLTNGTGFTVTFDSQNEVQVVKENAQINRWEVKSGGVSLSNNQFMMPENNVEIEGVMNSYTITYNANGGINAPSATSKSYGVDATISSSMPKKDGYVFKGWSKNPNATEVEYAPGATYSENKSTILYAVWEENEEISIANIPVGAYIDYTPTADSASISDEYTGYSGGDQTLTIDKNASTKMKYKVYANNNGQLDIISASSVGTLSLEGATGYANAVYTLNTLCSQYVNEFADSAVSIGSTKDWLVGPVNKSNIDTTKSIGIIDTTEETGYPLTYAATSEYRDERLASNNAASNSERFAIMEVAYPYYDSHFFRTMPVDDSLYIPEVLRSNDEYVWLASRELNTIEGYSIFFVFVINSDGWVDGGEPLHEVNSTESSSRIYSHGVRPVISLKDCIKITGGSGTEDDPYTIGFDT